MAIVTAAERVTEPIANIVVLEELCRRVNICCNDRRKKDGDRIACKRKIWKGKGPKKQKQKVSKSEKMSGIVREN